MSSRRKLLLVIPNQRWLKDDIVTTWNINPRFLCVMGAVVKDLVDVEILDCQRYALTVENFAQELHKRRPDFVGISILTSEYQEVLDEAARISKRELPDVPVIAGGVHVTMEYERVIANLDIDYACRGEGDLVLRDLLLYLLGKGPEPVTGWVYRKKGLVFTGPHSIVEDLTALPFPDYSLVDYSDYVISQQRQGSNRVPELPGTTLNIARGCPCPCTFCQVASISGKKIRSRSAQQIVEEIEYLRDTYGVRSIAFYDDNFFLSKKIAKETLALMSQRKVGLKWSAAGFAVFALDDEYLELIADSGCTSLNIAIESGNERVLRDLIKKPIKDLKTLPDVIAKIRQKGIDVIANFIIGYPGERWDEIMDTIRYAESCGAHYVKFFVAVPLKGTVMYDMAVEMDALAFPSQDLKVDWRHAQLKSDEWSERDVSALRVYEWDRINFSPERIEDSARIWGMTIDEVNLMRQQTRNALYDS
ncbi:MAG: B12-binding domain-containing radical SAM protein [Alphaproteobacteria bacterium]|nr:B12-binding domain-containing radical SAM protein [Alphaproteobacteria bacterium]